MPNKGKKTKQARNGFGPTSAMKGIRYFQNLRNCLRNVWEFLEMFGKSFRTIFLEEFFRTIFGKKILGWIFGRIFLRGLFWEDFFEKEFFGRFFLKEFVARNYLVEIDK